MMYLVECFCLYVGVVLFVASFICLFIPRYWRLGIIGILVADIPLAISIAFPKKVTNFLINNEIAFFTDETTCKIAAICVGIIIFLIMASIYVTCFMKYLYKNKALKNNKANTKNEGQESIDDSDGRREGTLNTLNKFKDKGQESSVDKADPAIFANVRDRN